jgi:hypothetical protein
MQDQRVEGIAIFTFGGWNKTPVVRIGQPEDQGLRQREQLQIRVEFELRGGAARSFNHDVNVALFVTHRKFAKVDHDFQHREVRPRTCARARLVASHDQLAALRLTPLRSATVESFLSAAFSSLRLVLSSRMMSSWPRLSAQAINVP